MNCIDCYWAIQLDPEVQCRKASPDVKWCDKYQRAHKTITKQVEEMLEG